MPGSLWRRLPPPNRQNQTLALATLLVLFSLLLSWATAAVPPALRFPVGRTWHEPYLQGFYFPERQGGHQFRWSGPRAAVELQGLAGLRRYELLLAAATRHPDTPVEASVRWGDKNHSIHIPWEPAWLSIGSVRTGWDLDGRERIEIQLPSFRAPPDERELGLMLSGIRLVPSPRIQLAALPALLPALWLAAHTAATGFAGLRLGWSTAAALTLALLWRTGYGGLDVVQPERYGGWFVPAPTVTALAALALWGVARAAVHRLPALRARLALLSAGALGLMGAAVAYRRILLPQGPLGWDEADHTMWAHWTAEALRRWDLLELWQLAHRQHFWPPLYSWWQALVFLTLGETEVTARLGPLIALVVVCLLVAWIVLRLGYPYGPALAVGAALLCAASPRLLTFASLAMFELPVTVFILLTLAGLQQALGSERPRAYALAGALAFLLFLAKFNYGLMLLAAFGMYQLVDRRLRGSLSAERVSLHLDRRQAAFWAVVLLLVLGWFVVEPVRKLEGFLGFVTNQSSGYPLWSAANLLFYPRSWVLEYLPHPALALVALPLVLLGIARSRPGFERLLMVLVLVGFLAGTLHPLKAERYIGPLVPVVAVLVMLGLAEVLEAWHRWRGALPGRLLAVGGLLLAVALSWAAWQRIHPWHAPGREGEVLHEAVQTVEARVQPTRPLLFLGTFAELSGNLLEWHLLTQNARAAGTLEFDPYGPVEDPHEAEEVLKALLADRPRHLVIGIEVLPDSALDLPDYRRSHAWKRTYLEAMRDMPGWRPAWEAAYPELGLRLVAYERGA